MTDDELTQRLQRLEAMAATHAERLDTDRLHIRSLATLAQTTLDSIQALERTAATLERIAENHQNQIDALVHEWQAYLRTLRPQ